MRSQLSFEPHPFIRPPSRSRVYLFPFRGDLAHRKSSLVIICPNSNLVLSTLIWPQNTILVHIQPYLPIFTTIYLHLAIFRLNYPYLGIFALNSPDFTICATIFTLYMHSSIETAPPCKMLEQSDHYSWRYCISKIWGIQVSSANAVWVLIQSLTNFFVASGTSPLYKI